MPVKPAVVVRVETVEHFRKHMPALGQKADIRIAKVMSALPPKADMCGALAHVCFGPKADICSLNDYIHALQKFVGDAQAQRLRSLEVDDQLVLSA